MMQSPEIKAHKQTVLIDSWLTGISGADSIGHVPPLLQMAGHGGAPWV